MYRKSNEDSFNNNFHIILKSSIVKQLSDLKLFFLIEFKIHFLFYQNNIFNNEMQSNWKLYNPTLDNTFKEQCSYSKIR